MYIHTIVHMKIALLIEDIDSSHSQMPLLLP